MTNKLIVDVLQTTTEQKFGDDPNAWWKWWQNENDYYAMPKQPVYQDSYAQTSDSAQPTFVHSSFAKGTPVWTKTGRTRIESLRAGDLVLSQNVDTGELKYEPVVARAERPPTALFKVSVDGDTFHSNQGESILGSRGGLADGQGVGKRSRAVRAASGGHCSFDRTSQGRGDVQPDRRRIQYLFCWRERHSGARQHAAPANAGESAGNQFGQQ